MANHIVKTINLGKYAGTCPQCGIMRGTEEVEGVECGRCGHIYDTKAVHLDLDGNEVVEEKKEEKNEDNQ